MIASFASQTTGSPQIRLNNRNCPSRGQNLGKRNAPTKSHISKRARNCEDRVYYEYFNLCSSCAFEKDDLVEVGVTLFLCPCGDTAKSYARGVKVNSSLNGNNGSYTNTDDHKHIILYCTDCFQWVVRGDIVDVTIVNGMTTCPMCWYEKTRVYRATINGSNGEATNTDDVEAGLKQLGNMEAALAQDVKVDVKYARVNNKGNKNKVDPIKYDRKEAGGNHGKICKFWRDLGTCKFGNQCKFIHVVEEHKEADKPEVKPDGRADRKLEKEKVTPLSSYTSAFENARCTNHKAYGEMTGGARGFGLDAIQDPDVELDKDLFLHLEGKGVPSYFYSLVRHYFVHEYGKRGAEGLITVALPFLFWYFVVNIFVPSVYHRWIFIPMTYLGLCVASFIILADYSDETSRAVKVASNVCAPHLEYSIYFRCAPYAEIDCKIIANVVLCCILLDVNLGNLWITGAIVIYCTIVHILLSLTVCQSFVDDQDSRAYPGTRTENIITTWIPDLYEEDNFLTGWKTINKYNYKRTVKVSLLLHKHLVDAYHSQTLGTQLTGNMDTYVRQHSAFKHIDPDLLSNTVIYTRQYIDFDRYTQSFMEPMSVPTSHRIKLK